MIQLIHSPWTRRATVIGVTLMLAACNKGQPAAPAATGAPATANADSVAVVDGKNISRQEYDALTKGLLRGKPADNLTPEEKGQILDQLIELQLLSEQATKDGVDKDADTAARLDVVHMQILADAEAQKFLKSVQPTETELHAEFDAQNANMDKTEYHARHILVATKDKELADQITKKLKGGAKFDDLAKANSIDPGSKGNGGDLGWFTASRMVKPFSDAVKELKKGEVTAAPVQTQYGWHVIKLEDTRDTQPPPFDVANKQQQQQLSNGIIQKKLQAYLEGLKKNAKIEKKLT